MANNRMFLCHKPSGMAVYLGKTMADGWYGVPGNVSERIQALFDYAHDESDDWNDFRLAVEDDKHMPGAFSNWHYDQVPVKATETHFVKLIISEE